MKRLILLSSLFTLHLMVCLAQTAQENYRKAWEAMDAKNYAQAISYYEKAANQGLVDAQFDLATCYYWGEGVTKNLQKAAYWFEKAANQGDM